MDVDITFHFETRNFSGLFSAIHFRNAPESLKICMRAIFIDRIIPRTSYSLLAVIWNTRPEVTASFDDVSPLVSSFSIRASCWQAILEQSSDSIQRRSRWSRRYQPRKARANVSDGRTAKHTNDFTIQS